MESRESNRRKMSILSQDLITEILSLLPVKSLIRFQCVSKAWFALINDPNFIQMHLENNRERSLIVETSSRYYFGLQNYSFVNFSNEYRFDEAVKIFTPFYRREKLKYSQVMAVIGCCNGLVCIRRGIFEIVIWNPSIKKYKKLRFEPVDDEHKLQPHLLEDEGFNFAFGYDPVNNDYKVLRIVEFLRCHKIYKDPPTAVEVKVYSLKAHSWTRVEDEWPHNDSLISSPRSAFTNGAFHWLTESATGTKTLLAFDLTTEKFEVQKFPFKNCGIVGLEVLGGSLCVSVYPWEQGIEVWMMKEYRVATSWSRLYTVPATFSYCQSLMLSEDGEKVLMENDEKVFYWYDIKKKTLRIVENHHQISNSNSNSVWTTTCVGTRSSLLLLNGDSEPCIS
jgi:F-box interacting protein